MDLGPLSSLSKKEALQTLQTRMKGLTMAEVKKRLKEYGPNQIKQHEISWWRLLFNQFTSPFVYLLVASTILSFLFGDPVSAWMIIGFVVLNSVLGFIQEYHAEKAVLLLQAILRPSCKVMRDGEYQRVACAEIVPGDICLLEVGDIVPADGIVMEAEGCMCDESVLTGESFPVAKRETQALFAGTRMAQGWVTMVTAYTGKATSLGKLAKLTTDTNAESPYQKTIRRLSMAILWFVVIAVGLNFGLRFFFQGQSTLNWVQFAIFSVALAVSVVPETLPLVVTICLSRGGLQMAKKQVVVKRLSSIEDLGAIEVLCTDKTGTLTVNQMRVAETKVYRENPIKTALLCVEASQLKKPEELNAFDRAMVQDLSKDERRELNQYTIEEHLPFDPKRRCVTSFVRGPKNVTQLVTCGAPEEVFKKCVDVERSFLAWARAQGKEGHRVLAVARRGDVKHVTKDNLSSLETGMELCGGIAFEDPLKPSAVSALKRIHDLGIRVKMLTGDSPEVATAIAKRVNLIQGNDEVLTGEAFLKMSAAERRKQVKRCAVFARVNPEQKYEIIKELQRYSSVGFLGEGINDAPALKLANVGIAVKEASDIAREAADIILLDKGLDVIAEGVTQGRQVFVNMGKYIRSTLVSNFGNFFAVVISLFFIPTLPMLPIQILLLNLLSDAPMTAICLDTVEERAIRRPIAFPIRSMLFFCLTLGAVSTVFDFMFFWVYQTIAPSHLQVMWFLGSVFTELILIFSLRSSGWFFQSTKPPRALWFATLFAGGLAFLVTCVYPFAQWFSFSRPTVSLFAITLGLVLLYFGVTDIVKRGYIAWTEKATR